MFRAYIYKIFNSGLLYLSIIGVFSICCMRMLKGELNSPGDLVTEFGILLDIDAYRKVIVVFSALPFTMNFASEWKNNVTNSCVIRSSRNKYIVSNLVLCFITAFLVVFIGMMLFVFVDSMRWPIYNYNPSPKITPFGILIDMGHPMAYIAIRAAVFAISCSMWSITGLVMASVFPDVFVSIATPFITSYLLERLTMQLPPQANLWYLSLSYVPILNNAVVSFIYTVGLFVLLSVCFGLLFAKIVKRRIANEFL